MELLTSGRGLFANENESQQVRAKHTKYNKTKQSNRFEYRQSTAAVLKHRILPVFGKRSTFNKDYSTNTKTSQRRFKRHGIVGDEPNTLDRIHIRYHRSSRQEIYQKIETYLDKRGLHGHHCVLKTLCEAGQKSKEREPGSFVTELMRAIFTLPEQLDDEAVTYRLQRYDTANSYSGDCAARYHFCKDSLWTSPYVI